MILLRALVRVLTFLLLLALALAGLAAAVFSIQDGTRTLSYDHLASLARLPEARDAMAGWFAQVSADGPIALVALLCGVGAILVGVVILVGVLVPRRERLVSLEQRDGATLAARRRPLASAAGALAEQARGVTDAKVRARPRRRGGGTLRVRADRTALTDAATAEKAITAQLQPLTGPFDLRPKVQSREAGRGSRVQ